MREIFTLPVSRYLSHFRFQSISVKRRGVSERSERMRVDGRVVEYIR